MSDADKKVGRTISAITGETIKTSCRGAFALTANPEQMFAACEGLERALCDELALVIVASCGLSGEDVRETTMRIAALLVDCVAARIEDYKAFVDDKAGGGHERH